MNPEDIDRLLATAAVARMGKGSERQAHRQPPMNALELQLTCGAAVRCSVLLDPVVLFALPDSYYKSLGLDCYDEARDARSYTGNAPVIAHPPCQRWGNMGIANYVKYGHEHLRPGNDGGCFKFALDTVNRCGGVLEHPASTHAWPAYGLQRPPKSGWGRSGNGWVCEVWQSAYGHRANKKTWLYCFGTDAPIEPRWERIVGTHQVGFPDKRGKARNKPNLSKREANATPPEFAAFLIELAKTCAQGSNDKLTHEAGAKDV